MCHGVGQDGCMMNVTKASNILCALFVLHGARARVCVGGGGGIVMRQQGTPSQMVRFISPNPNPVTISPYPFTSHGTMWPCVHVQARYLHTRTNVVVNWCMCMCVWTCVWVYVCVCVWIFVSLMKCVCLDVCVFVATGTCMQVCMCACTLKSLEKRLGKNCGPMLL